MLDETATKLSPRFDNFLLQIIECCGSEAFVAIHMYIDRVIRAEILLNAKLRERHLHGRRQT